MFNCSEVFLNLFDVIVSQLHESFEFRPRVMLCVNDKKVEVKIPERVKIFKAGIS